MVSELKKLNFVDKVILDNGGFFLYDFTALDINREQVWYFLAVPKSASDAFVKTIKQENIDIDITQYGEIIASGKGAKAPEEVRELLVKKYDL